MDHFDSAETLKLWGKTQGYRAVGVKKCDSERLFFFFFLQKEKDISLHDSKTADDLAEFQQP